jgi:hypothetical protein
VTITSNHVFPPLEKPDVDQRRGSSDIAWAERAYHHQPGELPDERRRVPATTRGRPLRILVTTLAIVAVIVGLVVAIRLVGSSPSPVAHRTLPGTSAPAPTTDLSPFTLTPQLLRPFPSLTPAHVTSKG